MPFISIIIPTHNNEEHIEQAILSCFDSDFDDFEIIVINDASTDQTAKIIQALAKNNEKHIITFTNSKKLGTGISRNIGIENAQGEYLLFLDGDDWFEPNAIKIVANTTEETQAEVIIFNHQRAWPNNVKTPNLPNIYTNLNHSRKNISDPYDRKGAMKNLHTAWNKSYKTNYIKKNRLQFTSGIYEDIPWSIKAVCLAKEIYYHPSIIINYRQWKNSITKVRNEHHFDVFDQINDTLCFIKENNDVQENYKIELYDYCKLLLFGIIKTNYRIHKKDEYEFIKKSYNTISIWRKELKIKKLDVPWLSLISGNRNIFMLTQKKLLNLIQK